MRTIEEQTLLDRKGNDVIINIREDDDSVPVPTTLTLRWVLEKVANSYVPDHSLTLQVGELRSLLAALNVLDNDELKVGDKMEFSDESFDVLKKVVLHIIPSVTVIPMLMCAPQVEDILNSV